MLIGLTTLAWFTTIHVMAAVLWVGGGALLTLYAILTIREHDPRAMASFAQKAALIGGRYFSALSFVVLGFGFGVVEESNGAYSYGNFFVTFGLVGWGVSTATGILFLGPESGRLSKLLAERPPEDPEVQYRIRRILTVARIDVLVLLAIVFVMAAKPFWP
jgi:uncharacterized membrane protein